MDSQEKNEANAQSGSLPIENIVSIAHGKAITDSRVVAKIFRKQHKNVLRDIDKLIEAINGLAAQNRAPMIAEKKVANPTIAGLSDRYYEMDRDAFTLLAMGFTGSEALRWKITYIEAFNTMETALAKTWNGRSNSNADARPDRSFDTLLAERGLTPDRLLKLLFGSEVPATGDPDYPLFAAEACAALGIAKPEFEIALARLPDTEKTILTIMTEEGPREHEVITELALYLLAFTPAVALPHGQAKSISNLAKYGDVLDAISLAHQIKIIETSWVAFQGRFLDLFPKHEAMLNKTDRLVEQAAREADDVLYRRA